MKENNEVYIIFKAYDTSSIEEAVRDLMVLIKHNKVKKIGPVPLPVERKLYTVNRSVHIYSTAKEQFERITHKRMIHVQATSSFIEAVSQMRLPAGVFVKIKMNNARGEVAKEGA